MDKFWLFLTLGIKGQEMDYQQYGVENFVLDQYFRSWVLFPDKESHEFWKNWLDEHPYKAETLAEAIEFIRQLGLPKVKLSDTANYFRGCIHSCTFVNTILFIYIYFHSSDKSSYYFGRKNHLNIEPSLSHSSR